MGDEELINIMLTSELMPDAESDLKAVLAERGVDDLSSHRAHLEADLALLEHYRTHQINRRSKIWRWCTRVITAFSLAIIAFGAYLLASRSANRPGDDGSLMIFIGVIGILFAFLNGWLSRLWDKHVLFRASPTKLREVS